MPRIIALLLVFLIAMTTLIIARPTVCQNTPSVPLFTVQLTNHSLAIPTTYSIDPYTNESIIHSSSHFEWRTVDFTIENQLFTHYSNNGETVEFYYNIRYKGHFGMDWIEIFGTQSYPSQNASSQKTIVSFALAGQNASQSGLRILQFPPNGQVDFQVQALIGVIHRIIQGPMSAPWIFTGETSGWSNTQTVTISNNSTTTNPEKSTTPNQSVLPSQNPTATLIQPDAGTSVLFGWVEIAIVILLGVVVVVLLVFVVVFQRKRSLK